MTLRSLIGFCMRGAVVLILAWRAFVHSRVPGWFGLVDECHVHLVFRSAQLSGAFVVVFAACMISHQAVSSLSGSLEMFLTPGEEWICTLMPCYVFPPVDISLCLNLSECPTQIV